MDNRIEQLLKNLDQQLAREAEYARQEEENKIKMLAAGYHENDFRLMQAFFAWIPECSEVLKFLSIMIEEFDHLPSANMAKVFTDYMKNGAFMLHERCTKAGIDKTLYGLRPLSESNEIFDRLIAKAEKTIQKHENLKTMVREH